MRRVTPVQLIKHYGSQRAAGAAVGVTQQAVCNWKKNGRIPYPYDFIARLRIRQSKGLKP